jgi:hypothetical protein
MTEERRVLRLEVPLDSEADVEELRSALVAARAFAGKFGEVRGRRLERRGLGAGLGEGVERRWQMLDRLIAALPPERGRG